MNILVINCGSSSLNFHIYSVDEAGMVETIASGKARNVGTLTREKPRIDYTVNGQLHSVEMDLQTHRQAARECLNIIHQNHITIDTIGHRFVHGGKWLTQTTRVTHASQQLLMKCLPLAPIHNPNSYSVVQVASEELPDVPQFLVFDTAFHANMPEAARLYALPSELADQYGFQKYGFHGLSYQFISSRAASLLGIPIDKVKLIMCHLGTGGSSVAAFMDGHTLDTSMGYSPLPGLVMSTRCGDLDPEIVLELMRQGRSADEIDALLNNSSGLIGLSGYSSNLVEIIAAAEQGNERCRLAYEVYATRLKNYIGGYYWQMNGADAIIFTDDVGTNCWQLREKVSGGADQLGVRLDKEANRTAKPDQVNFINTDDSIVKIISMPTDEESIILHEVIHALKALR
jgi:acetate kinase